MRISNGIGSIAPAPIPVYANSVITPEQAMVMKMRTALGCADCGGSCDMRTGTGLGIPGVVLLPELDYETQQGRDVEYAVVGLSGGVGDWLQSDVANNPGMVGPFSGKTNGIVNALSQARGMGVGAVDTTSLSAFAASLQAGNSTLMGLTLPNWAWAGLAAVGVVLATGAHKGRR